MRMFTKAPRGQVVLPRAGDVVFVKTRSITGWMISLGEWLRFRKNDWSHVAMAIDDEGSIIEALWHGIVQDDISKYSDMDYLIVHTSKTILSSQNDLREAQLYLFSQLLQPYGYATLIGTATRFLLPGHSFAFIGSHNICSGLVAQALARGTFIPLIQPVTMSPSELADSLIQ